MATSTEIGADGCWAEVRGDLYHGIPCRIRVPPSGAAAARDGWRILERVDDVFNVHRTDSELGAINARGAGAHPVSPWLQACLVEARHVEALSGGAWTATMLPLVRLWREAARRDAEPDVDLLARTRGLCGPQAWSLEGAVLHLRLPGAACDLGGLAKGFAVDLVVELLRQRGIDRLLVQVGGETACLGADADGAPQRIAIPHPDDPDGAYCAVLDVPAAGLCGSTSGDYRQGHLVAGRTHHHVLDPRSGRPAGDQPASVTCVFAGTGRNALADGLSTAATVLGAGSLGGFAAATGCAGLSLRRDLRRGLLASATPGWRALAGT